MDQEKRLPRSKRRRKLNLLRFGAILAALALMVLAGYAGVKYTMAYLFPDQSWDSEETEEKLPDGEMNLLLLGVDTRKGEAIARADSIIFVHANTAEQSVAIMSIPRDTRVEIPGRGMDKINATTVYGGPEMTREVVSELLGVPVPYHVVVDFNGFKEIVDIMGGVTIDVESRMYYRDPQESPPFVIDLQPGEQRLDGDKAMQYVRYRGDGLADITRTQRQQKFLMALADEMLSPKVILKLPKLVPELNKNIDTNLGLKDMVKWAGMAKNLNNLQMVSGTLPGTFWDSAGISYWYVDPEHAKVAFADLLAGNPITDPIDPGVVTPTPVVQNQPETEDEPETPENGAAEGGDNPDASWESAEGNRGDGTEGEEGGNSEPGDTVPADDPPANDGATGDEEDIPGWIPVDEDTSGVVDDGRGVNDQWRSDNGRSTPGVGVEYGSVTNHDPAFGG